MKMIRSLLFVGIVLMLASAAGCAATPEARWYQQRDALNTANQIYLANVPVMNDQQIVYHGELLQAARSSLEQARQHLPDGGLKFDTTLDGVESILIQLTERDASNLPATSSIRKDTTNERH